MSITDERKKDKSQRGSRSMEFLIKLQGSLPNEANELNWNIMVPMIESLAQAMRKRKESTTFGQGNEKRKERPEIG